MLQRQLYALTAEGCEVKLFLRDQHRWIDAAIIHAVESDLVTIRYRLPKENSPSEHNLWEEMIRLDSIGSISRKVTSRPSAPNLRASQPVAIEKNLYPLA